MIITATIRLQDCTTNARKAFVAKQWDAHGIAKGPIKRYQVTGSSWAHIRRILKLDRIMGHSAVGPKTVESWTEDIGTAIGRLREASDS